MSGASTTGADVTPKNYDRMAGLPPLGSPGRPFPGGDLGPVRSLSPAAPASPAPAATASPAPTVTASPAPTVTAPAATAPAAPRFSGAVTDLAKSNQIANPNLIRAGSTLNLPGGQSYTVAKGDTLSGIAAGQFKGTAPAAAVPAASAPTPTGVRSGPNTSIDAGTRARALASVASLPTASPTSASPTKSQDSIDLKEDPLDRILKLAGRRKGY
jgi:LysM repeat protein